MEAIQKQFGLEDLEKTEDQFKLTKEQEERLKKAFANPNIFVIKKTLPSEEINGVDTYHYAFTINREGLLELFSEIADIMEEKELSEEALQEVRKSLEEVEMPEGEIWIGKKDFLLYKVLVDYEIKGKEDLQAEEKISFTIQLKNHNKLIEVEAPSPVKKIEDVFQDIFGDSSAGLFNGGLPENEPNFQFLE